MTDTQKPPMTVWLWPQTRCKGVGLYGDRFENRDGTNYTTGPYVHLDQFLEEVDKLGKQMFNSSFHHGTRAEMEVLALQKLVKEIKEQQ